MSNPDGNPTAAWFAWATAPPSRVDPLLSAIPEVFDQLEVRPTRMIYSVYGAKGDAIKRSVYTVERMRRIAQDPETVSLGILAREGDPRTEIHLHLHDMRGFEAATTHRPAVLSRSRPGDVSSETAHTFLAAVIDAYSVAQGGGALFPTDWHAVLEARMIGNSSIKDSDVERRLAFDGGNLREAMSAVRRLYPVTVFGAELWTKLPPLPDVDPAPKVEVVGNCRVLTCWPTLVDPHDPAFLLGTRTLRRWLWPYTIQNPADDPDAVDSKLRWAGLLPWE